MARRDRRPGRLSVEMSTPSMRIAPAPAPLIPPSASMSRQMDERKVDLPEPVRPTMPTLALGGMVHETARSTNGSSGRYRTARLRTSIAPADGQWPAGGSSPPWRSDGTWVMYSTMRSMPAKDFWTSRVMRVACLRKLDSSKE
eukprot:scaffold7738_cov107-Isochrysis_galbana.AAC.13